MPIQRQYYAAHDLDITGLINSFEEQWIFCVTYVNMMSADALAAQVTRSSAGIITAA